MDTKRRVSADRKTPVNLRTTQRGVGHVTLTAEQVQSLRLVQEFVAASPEVTVFQFLASVPDHGGNVPISACERGATREIAEKIAVWIRRVPGREVPPAATQALRDLRRVGHRQK